MANGAAVSSNGKNKRKIGIVWHSVYPWDIRLEKFCRTLAAAGNDVVLISRGSARLPPREKKGNVTMVRINPFRMYLFYRTIRNEKVRTLIVRDLPLALPAGLIGTYLNIPVFLDMAENYPAALRQYGNRLYRPFLFNDAWLARRYEKIALRYMDHVLVVAEEQKERLERLGYPAARIAVVRNTPDCERLGALARSVPEGVPRGRYVLYSGFIDRHRGIRTLVLAFNEIKDTYPDLTLVLVGKGNACDELKALVADLQLSGRVLFRGWVDFASVPAYIKHSTLCVIPHVKSEHTDTTLPNKIFDYLYFGRPVLASDADPLKRIIRESGSGWVFKSGDHADLARAMRRALESEWSDADGKRGTKLVEEKYNWGRDSAAFLNAIESNGSSYAKNTRSHHG